MKHISAITPHDIQKAFLFCEILLSKNEQLLNDLNVFPVPDGDTGTNMLKTIEYINQKIKEQSSTTLNQLYKIITHSSLMGARGNSGVILSQFIIGFFENFASEKEITVNQETLVQAANKAKDLCYQCVAEPKEGTMLTVIRKAVEEFEYQTVRHQEVDKAYKRSLSVAKKTLRETPDIMPLLKQAGVVDAGGAGFIFFMEAFKQAIILKSEKLDFNNIMKELSTEFAGTIKNNQETNKSLHKSFFIFRFNFNNILYRKNLILLSRKLLGIPALFTYHSLNRLKKLKLLQFINLGENSKRCLEILLEKSRQPQETIQSELEKLGESIVIAGDQNVYKIHIHTGKPHHVLSYLVTIGTIKNKRLSILFKNNQNELVESQTDPKDHTTALMAVSHGEGYHQLLSSYQIKIINGGEKLNPSVEMLLHEFDQSDADTIIFFPNNKNLYLAAEKAGQMCLKNVYVIHSPSIAQTLSAVINYNPQNSLEQNITEMQEIIENSQLLEIGQAVKDTQNYDKYIKADDFVAMAKNDTIIAHHQDLIKTVTEAIKETATTDTGLISLYRGKQIENTQDKKISDQIKKIYPHLELQFYDGGQHTYQYQIVLES